LQDTDVAGYLRHAHEQNLISTIEEGRKETQDAFYRVLEERSQHEWEAKKRRVFEELGGRIIGENKAMTELNKSNGKSNVLVSSCLSLSSLSNPRSSRQAYLPVLLCRCKAK
jgi:nuclear pore complex protein Nup93